MKLKAVIFDVDGVLVDSKKANVAFYQALLKKAGYPVPTEEQALAGFHLPLRPNIERLTGTTDKNELQRIVELVHKYPTLRDSSLFEFPEKLEEVLEELHKKYRLAIVTSRIKSGMDDVFSAKQIKQLFDVVVTHDDYDNPKPHPEPLLIALKKLNLGADEAIYIGDSPTDIEAANAAGMPSIFLSARDHPDATMPAREFHELVDVVEELIKRNRS